MARSRDLTPAEAKLAQWVKESKDEPEDLAWDAEFSMQYPSLWLFLTWRTIGDVVRTPGRLSLQVDGTSWRLGYYDPSAKRSCAVVGATLADCLSRLNAALTAPETVWSGGKPKSTTFRKRKSE